MKVELLGLSLLTVLLFLIFSLLLVKYFFLLKKVNVNFKKTLFFCRFITLLCLIILMLDPWINWDEIKHSNQDLNIYLDNSKSIGSIASSINFNAKMNYINNWGKNNDVLINWYLFGDSTRILGNKGKLFQDKISSLLGIKKNIILDQESNHMIISDGHINKGENFDNIIIDNKNIYISGFGKDINNADCYISSIVPNRKNDNSLDLIINLGCFLNDIKNMSIEIILSNYKNNIIRSEKRTLRFNKNGFQDIVLENIDRNNLSIFNTIDIKTDIDELNYNNNRKHFVINEIREIKKVLLLSGGLSANTKFIKRVISDKFPYLEIIHDFGNKENNYMFLDEYSLIILDNFPFSNKHLDDYKSIINNSIPTIYFQGPEVSISIAEKIAKSLDLKIISNKLKNSNITLVNNHFLFNKINFNKFPPTSQNISWILNDSNYKPLTYFSNESIAAIKGNKLSAVFISDLSNSNLIESNLFNTNNVIDYTYNMILNEYELDSSLIKLNIDEVEHNNNNMINFCITVDEKIIDSEFYLNIHELETESKNEIPLGSKISSDCNYNFMIEKQGTYYLQVLSKDDNSNFESNKEYIVVNDFDIELEFLYQNKKSLHNFRTNNNAVYFDFKNLEQDLNKISQNKIINVNQSNFNSLSTQYYWILFIIFLGLEWYLRKKNKLL